MWRTISRHPAWWAATLSLCLSALIALTAPLPEPRFHDEFSHLLAGDTFSRGRLTNPPHRLWPFFETFHVIHQPTYMSKYPPGQGLFLAMGQLIGAPIVGVWISTALACAALGWGLGAFMPRGWAALGGVLAASHPLLLDWNYGFWGGAVPAMGGALAIGGLMRLLRRGGVGAGFAAGLGIFILAISRPFEGAVVMLLAVLLIRPRIMTVRRHLGRGMLAGGAVLLIGAAWIAYYNWRITHSPLHLPYMVYESTYAITAPFIWIPWDGRVPEYRNAAMREYYESFWLELFLRQRTLNGFLEQFAEKLWKFAKAMLLPVGLIVPLLILPGAAARDRLLRRALIVAAAFTLMVMGHLGFFPHYVAPATLLYLFIVVQCLRHQRARLRRAGGRWIVSAVVVMHAVVFAWWLAALDRSTVSWQHNRAELTAALRQTGVKHLVIVRPLPGAVPHFEWVYNEADIDAAPVVWARDLGARNRELLEYFDDRRVLLLEVEEEIVRLQDPAARPP